METLQARAGALRRSEAAWAAIVAAAAAALLVAVAPPGDDAAAHLYRTFLVEKGVGFWDNLWYGGQYPFASYSLLYYLPASVVGNVPLVFAAVVLSAVLFASIAEREWGPRAARWPARAFAVVAAGPLVTGTYTYALGLAALLGCIRALQASRTWLAVLAAALALGFSPLAFVFLCAVLLAVLITRRRIEPRAIVLGAGILVLVAFEAAMAGLFPVGGSYPFRSLELGAVLGVTVAGAALAFRTPRGAALATFFLVWAVASVVAYVVPSPLGENLARLRYVVFPLVLLAAALASFRPRWLALAAVAGALVYNVAPYLSVAASVTNERAAHARFWRPAIAFLRQHSGPSFRVDVVPVYGHWEAYYLPRAGIPLTRGWYRQLDLGENKVLYRKRLTAAAYRSWLRRMGVRYVLLPEAQLDRLGAAEQADLLRSGRSGLAPVFASPEGVVYELPHATPILTGPGRARLTTVTHARIVGWAAVAGTYRLRVRFTPYWKIAGRGVCVYHANGGMTRLEVRRPGQFVLTAPEGATAVVRSLLERDRRVCSGH
jgi:hypothetical protein